MARTLVLLFALLGALLLPGVRAFAQSGDAAGYAAYVNDKYGYEIAYPADVFRPQGESDAGDGQRFLAADGATLTVYGGYNVLSTPLAEEYAAAQKSRDGQASYKVLKKTWFVVSGLDGATIWYRKTMDAGDRRFTFELTYPAAKKATYDRIIPRILESFRAP